MQDAIRALVTAFEPFGGERINASHEAVRRLPARVGMLDVTTVQLPTSFRRALSVLENEIARVKPGIVLCVGQASERTQLNIERVAINLQDARIPDNDGAQPIGAPVVAGAPAAYFATLPVRAIADALSAAGLAAEISNSAGTFVCNHVFYGLMHLAAASGGKFRSGFLHVPSLQSQATPAGGPAPMPLDDIVRGIRIALEVANARSPANRT